VQYQAAALNTFVMEELHRAGVPALPFPPSACVMAREGKVARWDTEPLARALANGLVPVVYGDVTFDEVLGGTILSTEELFEYLAPHLRPTRVLLAGLEAGVWEDFPARTRLIPQITSDSYAKMRSGIGPAGSVDVTGGMESKVGQMLELVKTVPGLKVVIFSGETPGDLGRALQKQPLGTVILL
jgi:isopentenyl phosphate kinase